MNRISKSLAVFIILIMAISSLSLLMIKPAFAFPIFPYPTPETQNFTYFVSNYAVNYSIIKQTPSAGGEYSGYNLGVFENYPPFTIEISFYDDTQKVTGIAPTNAYSTSFVSTNYPTQITMTKVSNESTPTPPTTTQSPNTTPSVPEFPSWAITLLISIMLATAGLMVYFRKNPQEHPQA